MLTIAKQQLTRWKDTLYPCDIEWLPVGIMRIEAVVSDILNCDIPWLLYHEQSILDNRGEGQGYDIDIHDVGGLVESVNGTVWRCDRLW
jgi:hypothetical protein